MQRRNLFTSFKLQSEPPTGLSTGAGRDCGLIVSHLHGLQRLVHAKTRRLLPWGEFLEALEELTHDRLGRDYHVSVINRPAFVVSRFFRRALKWVRMQVDQEREAQGNERQAPNVEALRLLRQEDHLPFVVTQSREVAVIGEVKEFFAGT